MILHNEYIRSGEGAVIFIFTTLVTHLLVRMTRLPVLVVVRVTAELFPALRARAHRGERQQLDMFVSDPITHF